MTPSRRDFLKSSAAIIAASRLSRMESLAAQVAANKRVGLIGSGWYGKSDLLRLVQVAPVNVVSLCDVDSRMLSDAADLVATRQASKKRPRTYGDWRKMLAEKDLDLVLIDPPDHWHALPMIDAVKQGIDVWVQKPISVDVVEGQAMLAAARKYNRVVQVGLQRRSTPHLVTARDRIIREGKLGRIAYVEIYCYYHMRATENPPDTAPPPELDYEMWTGPAPMRPFNKLTHPRSWRAFMEYGNGIMGDMCVHMLDMVRWVQWTSRSGNSNIAVCVSVMFALLALSTKMPPLDVMRDGIGRSIIQRTMSSMCTHMSPMMTLPYSMNARQPRGCVSLLNGRIGAGPVHAS